MKMEHLLAQLDGVCEHAAKGDLDYKSGAVGYSTPLDSACESVSIKLLAAPLA